MKRSQNSTDITAETIFQWLKNDLKPFNSNDANSVPSLRTIRQVYRGNMIPIWKFLAERVKSEESVNEIRGNITLQNASSIRKTNPNVSSKPEDEKKSIPEPHSRTELFPNRNHPSPFSPTKTSEKTETKQTFKSRIRPPKTSSTLQEGNYSPKRLHELDESPTRFPSSSSSREQISITERLERLHNTLELKKKTLFQKLSRLHSEEYNRFFSNLDSTDKSSHVAILEAYDFHCDEIIEFFAEVSSQLEPSVGQIKKRLEASRKFPGLEFSKEKSPELMAFYDGNDNEEERRIKLRVQEEEERRIKFRVQEEEEVKRNKFRVQEEEGYLLHNQLPAYETRATRKVKKECEKISQILKHIFFHICPTYSLNSQNLPRKKMHNFFLKMENNNDDDDDYGDDDGIVERIKWLMKGEGEKNEKKKKVIFEILNSELDNFVMDPDLFLESISKYTNSVFLKIENDCHRINVKADAEKLRFEYENSKAFELNENNKMKNKKNENYSKKNFIFTTAQLLEERLKAHINQFQETERLEREANEFNTICLNLLKTNFNAYKNIFHSQYMMDADTNNKHISSEDVDSVDIVNNGANNDISNDELEKLKMEVLSLEIEAIASEAATKTYENEESRLNRLKADLIESNKTLDTKFTLIQEFDKKRNELEELHEFLLTMNRLTSEKIRQFASESQSFFSDFLVKDGQTLTCHLENSRDMIFKSVQSFADLSPKAMSNLSNYNTKLASRSTDEFKSKYLSNCFYDNESEHSTKSILKQICQLSDQNLDFHLAYSPERFLEHLSDRMLESLSLRHVSQIAQSKITDVTILSHDINEHLETCLASIKEHESKIENEKMKEIKEALSMANNSHSDIERITEQMNYWWNQPGGYVIDWLTYKGMTASQWLTKVKMLNSNLGN